MRTSDGLIMSTSESVRQSVKADHFIGSGQGPGRCPAVAACHLGVTSPATLANDAT